jgi:hypothetical protein
MAIAIERATHEVGVGWNVGDVSYTDTDGRLASNDLKLQFVSGIKFAIERLEPLNSLNSYTCECNLHIISYRMRA